MSDDQTVIPPARAARPMMIVGLNPSLPERGKLKIGRRGKTTTSSTGKSFQMPEKLDHFLITTMERLPAPDNNFVVDKAAHEKFGKEPTELPVRLLYDDPTLNFPTRYADFIGRKLWCTGNGETAQRLQRDGTHKEVQCPCRFADADYQPKQNEPPRCKMNGSLSVLLDGAGGIGGVWKFRTTSYNTIVGILSSQAFIRQVTGGILANVPLKMSVRPKQATAPDGSQQTVYIVSLEYAGNLDELQQAGHKIALDRAKTHLSVRNIEEEARRLLQFAPKDVPLPGDTVDEVVEEFYPEEAVSPGAMPGADAAPRPTRQDAPVEPEGIPFAVVTLDGEEKSFLDAEEATAAYVAVLRTAAGIGRKAVDGAVETNTLPDQLREIGLGDLALRCQAAHGEALVSAKKDAPAEDGQADGQTIFDEGGGAG